MNVFLIRKATNVLIKPTPRGSEALFTQFRSTRSVVQRRYLFGNLLQTNPPDDCGRTVFEKRLIMYVGKG